MQDDSYKVVDLNSRREATHPVALPPSIAALKDKTEAFLSAQFKQLLDNVDDNLFDLAEAASNAKNQQQYFDAMREIRLNRTQVEERFLQAISTNFKQSSTFSRPSLQESGKAKLQLLESEALEELVALEGMGKKGERQFIQEVWLLCTAWQQLQSGPVLAAADLPMGPQKIAKALGDACQSLEIDIKSRLVLFKLFEQQVLDKYGALFETLVPVLEAQGMRLDALKQQSRQEQAAEPQPETPTSAASGSSGNNQASVELAARLTDAFENLIYKPVGGSSEQKSQISKPSFMIALQDMQQSQFGVFKNADAANEGDYSLEQMSQKLLARLQQISRVSGSDSQALDLERDASTISFVGTLFQFMLEGDELSAPIKNLVARLQIPILKTAMLDRSFFNHEEHPARKLLSALVSAGIGWSPTGAANKDPLYRKVDEIVMRILGDFSVDTQIFIDVYQEFLNFQQKAMRRAEIMAQRTVDAEGGKAVAETARGYVSALLDQKLADGSIPSVVSKILREGWSKVLFLSYVQQGVNSERFNKNVEFIDRLLWSVSPSTELGHRSQLIAALPGLIETLRHGFNQVSLNGYEVKQWLDQLERLHLAKLSRAAQNPSANASSANSAGELAELDASLSQLDQKQETPKRHSVPLGDEMAAPIPERTTGDAAERINALRVGCWVDLRQEADKTLRCRLAAVINGIGKYIFVNRAGIKVAEFNREGLMAALMDDSLVIIEDHMMFDHALESVISNMREMKDRPLE
ncbi:DUF1631 domain-containing protein [Spongiibacter sp. KMU-158]|uniref:DUF1631 domain-containing protein n=1 Tax=Spongiibacter pelagi TaxID=2760804 RepID=A0A927GXT9_9GAMM|nr:DUF1631 domain-containing protein [Spongiibacter pelagi]MBD2859759.1 DUF1631 domain-containing protein [Spongiibacter pelagi]